MSTACAAMAQVKCKMPNGLVIEQKLATTCPAGATDINKPQPAKPARQTVPFHAGQRHVSANSFGPAWPLTVDSGLLACTPITNKTQAVTLVVNGSTYAVNGAAKSLAKQNDWRDIRWIWAPNPAIHGTNKPLGPLIDAGLQLCQ